MHFQKSKDYKVNLFYRAAVWQAGPVAIAGMALIRFTHLCLLGCTGTGYFNDEQNAY